jgi:hypothetical protein
LIGVCRLVAAAAAALQKIKVVGGYHINSAEDEDKGWTGILLDADMDVGQ